MSRFQKLRERVSDAALTVGLIASSVLSIPQFLIEERKRKKLARTLTAEKAAALDDETLRDCLYRRMMEEENWEEQIPEWNVPRRTLFTLWEFVSEVMNGGLCQYFVNSSRATAPYLEDALKEVGAERCRALFHDFVTENGIDVTDLDSFDIEDVSEFEDQNRRYPFDAFDDAFYDLYDGEALDELEIAYVRKNLDALFLEQ